MTAPFVPVDFVALSSVPKDDICPRACRALWASVLLGEWRLAFRDTKDLGRDGRFEVARAQGWFQSGDCAEVCGLLGLDVDYVRRKFAQRLAEGGGPICVNPRFVSRGPDMGFRSVGACL